MDHKGASLRLTPQKNLSTFIGSTQSLSAHQSTKLSVLRCARQKSDGTSKPFDLALLNLALDLQSFFIGLK
jgi:hypothetical protein